MKVTIVGGSAQSTPVLLEFLGRRRDQELLSVNLVGRDNQRLEAVVRAGKLLAPGLHLRQFGFEQLDQALGQSELVLIQVRVGGYEARGFDESFPLRYGIVGDEGLGPGGLVAAIRNWPLVSEILRATNRICPEACILMLTSPGSLLVRAAAMGFPDKRILGICELPLTTLTRVCEATDAPLEKTSFSYAGVNHLGWLYSIRCGSRDLVFEYGGRIDAPMREVIRRWGGVPLKYLRLHFEPDIVIKEQSGDIPRSLQLAALQQNSFDTFLNGDVDSIRDALNLRGAPWYTHAVGPFIAALLGKGDAGPFFLSIAAENGDVSERSYTLHKGRLQVMPISEAPMPIRALNSSFENYERAAAIAVNEPYSVTLTNALSLHPWVKDTHQAEELSEEILSHLSGEAACNEQAFA